MKSNYDYLTSHLLRLVALVFLVFSVSVLPMQQAVQAGSSDFLGPTGSGKYGAGVYSLPNGNFVVTDPEFSPGSQVKIGAVYLYDGTTHAQISRLTGSTDNDMVGTGGIEILKDGNFVVASPRWNNGSATRAGGATWCSATSGCPATVTATNSLVGSHTNDYVGSDSSVDPSGFVDYSGITPTSGSAYLVKSVYWSSIKGAVTYCASGSDSNCQGVVSSSNSLVGANNDDYLGLTVTLIPTGGYVVSCSYWDNGAAPNAGAAIPCPASGCKGVVSTSNSLYGTLASAQAGMSAFVLPDGGFVVQSYAWSGPGNDVGAATYCASVTDTNCIGKPVTASNSLTGGISNSMVASHGIVVLPDGNYIVKSPSWRKDLSTRTGAATYCTVSSGVSSCTGQTVSASNSLTGDWNQDNVGTGIFALSGGAFLVTSPQWHEWTGAVTFCSSSAACMGHTVSSSNSLVGGNKGPSWMDMTGGDTVSNGGGVLAFSDGSYAVLSSYWDTTPATKLNNMGAATFCPSTGCTGSVILANSLTGTKAGDKVGSGGGFNLLGGAMLISSPGWGNGSTLEAGALTYCSIVAACQGSTVQLSNSLVGDQDKTSYGGNYIYPFILSNGAYLMSSYYWDNGAETTAGALTWCPASGCTGMTVSAANSLVGSHANDYLGGYAEEVGDDLYVTQTGGWQNGALKGAGAVTLCSIQTGCSGPINSTNSVIGGVEGVDVYGDGSYYYSYNTYSYDTVNHQLLVGLPLENKIVFFTLSNPTVTISGNAGIGGVTLSYADGAPKTAMANVSGIYSFTVSNNWSGAVTPSLAGYTFSPDHRDYTGITTDQTSQDYTVSTCTPVGSGTVNWSIAFGDCPSGAKRIIPNGLTVVLDADTSLNSDLEVQSGGAFDPNGKTMTLTGSGDQTLTGNPLTFYKLTIEKANKSDTINIVGKLKVTKKLTITKGKLKSASDYQDIEIAVDGELELTNAITVGGNFTNSGTLTTNGYGVTFDGGVEQNLAANVLTMFDNLTVSSGTTLIETVSDDNVLVNGALTNNGMIRKTQAVSSATQYYFGLAGKFNGADMEINVTSLVGADPLTAIQVEQVSGDHSGRTGSSGNGVGWGHYWSIAPTGSDFVADVTLPHDVSTQSDAKACRFVSGTTWDCRQDAVTADTVTYNAATQFSDWAVGNKVGPTAVSVRAFSARSSQAVPLALLALCLAAFAGLALIWRPRRQARRS